MAEQQEFPSSLLSRLSHALHDDPGVDNAYVVEHPTTGGWQITLNGPDCSHAIEAWLRGLAALPTLREMIAEASAAKHVASSSG